MSEKDGILDILDADDLSEVSDASLDLVGDANKEAESEKNEMPDLADIGDLLEAANKLEDNQDTTDVATSVTLLDSVKDELTSLKLTSTYISNSPIQLSYKAEGRKSWVEVNADDDSNDDSSDSSLQKIDKPSPADVETIDDEIEEIGKAESPQPKSKENPTEDPPTSKSAESASAPSNPVPETEPKADEVESLSSNSSPESPQKPAEVSETSNETSADPSSPEASAPSTAASSSGPVVPAGINLKASPAKPIASAPVPKSSLPLGSLSPTPQSQEIVKLKNAHSAEKLELEQNLRRIKNENQILQQRLTSAEASLKTRDRSQSDLVKQISKLKTEKKAYEDQVRYWKNRAKEVENQINDSVAAEQAKMKEQLEMSNKKLQLMKTGHKRKTTAMEIELRRAQEKQSAMSEKHELPGDVIELQELSMNLKLEMRMKDAEMQVLNRKLVEYKSQIQYKDVAEKLQQDIADLQKEIALVHDSKKQIIRTLTEEIQMLRSIMEAYIQRPSVEDIRVGILKGYQFARATAIDVHGKLFTPADGTQTVTPRRDGTQSWG